ncbi:uncharacterized protein C5orf47 homolog isoform X2 [Emydura macquarii macquarii]|uniref:uncharacterized protein C5orf47 homolog isoform X2 n=1 Tax=Emydura macquarii macquarii TaxID=1129001 RepID=UPI00352A1DDE
MKSRSSRERMRIVYVNSFGTHRCGSVIQYGSSGQGRPAVAASGVVEREGSPISGGLQKNQADDFGFPVPSKLVKVIQRKKEKSEVFHGVLKVISKMLEENEKFRRRLLTCSQLNGEGNVVNQSTQNEASCMDRVR